CVGLLRSDRFELPKYSRWSSWEHSVLERLAEPAEAQQTILERQAISDAEDDEAGLIQDYFRDRIRSLHYDPNCDRVFLPSKVAAEWYCAATRENLTATKISRQLKQGITEGTITLLVECKRNDWGRGFIWWGPASTNENTRSDIEQRIEQQRI